MATASAKPPHVSPDQKPFRPYGAAEQLFYCRDPLILIEGPTRTGKSRGVLEKDFYCAMRWPGARILWIRKTRASMTESVLQTFEDHVLPVGSPIKSGAKRDQRSSYDIPGGSKIVIGGLDNVDRIMSSEYDRISIFEATETREAEVEDLATRMSNPVMPFRQITMDCNPGAPSHWLNVRAAPTVNVDRSKYDSVQAFNVLPSPEGKIRRLLSRLEDNPVMYDRAANDWTTMGAEYLKTLSNLGGVRKKRKVEGIWAAAEGLVYPNFENCIVRANDAAGRACDLPPLSLSSPALRVCAGLDWGWTDPTAVTVGAECHDGKIRLVEEFFESKVPPDVLAVRLRSMMARWGIEVFFCDPARPELIALMRRYDVPCVAHKVRMIETGIALVETRIDASMLEVYSCCLNLIREAGEYEYAKTADGRAKTVPKDLNNHMMDSLRYLVAGMDYGRTLSFSPMSRAMEVAPVEAEVMARLGQDPEYLRKVEADEAAVAIAEHEREMLEGDRGWG